MIDKYQQFAIYDRFLYGKISFKKDDIVVLIRRKSNGYPKTLSFDKEYQVINVFGNNIIIKNDNNQTYSCNKTFFSKKSDIRDITLERILKD